MEHGSEFVNDNNGVAQIPNTSPVHGNILDPGVMVHFDLKPDNSKSRVTKAKYSANRRQS